VKIGGSPTIAKNVEQQPPKCTIGQIKTISIQEIEMIGKGCVGRVMSNTTMKGLE
jgi:hypothetical protein